MMMTKNIARRGSHRLVIVANKSRSNTLLVLGKLHPLTVDQKGAARTREKNPRKYFEFYFINLHAQVFKHKNLE